MDSALADFERSLDERAKAALRELPEDVATNLLRDCQTRSVRNPSAYVFVAARKARPSQLNDTIERLQGDLDDKAIAQLRELPADHSMRILDELAQNWDQVRNPSAYVSTAVKNFHANHPPGGKLPPLGGGAPVMLGAPMDHPMAGVMGAPMGYGMMATMGPPPMAGAPPMTGATPDPLACAAVGQPLGAPMAPLMGHHPMAPQMAPPPGVPMATGAPLGAPMMATMLPTMGPLGAAMAPMGAQVPMGALGRPGAAVPGFPGCGGFGAFCGQPPPPQQPPPAGIIGSFAGLTQKQIEQELETSIARLGLDEIANEALHRVPLETAREILTALDGGVRNPSAFVMSKIRSFQDGAGGGSSGPSSRPPSLGLHVGIGALPTSGERPPESRPELQRRNDETLERFGADERAKNIAREIPPEALFDIFSQLSSHMRDIRNPSAFIFQACVNYQKQHPQPTGYPSYPPQQPFALKTGATAEQVDEAIQRLDLDTAASADMRALPPESAMGILEQITEGVKNKSAFATTAARRITGRNRSRSRSRSRSRRRGGAVAGDAPPPRGRSHSRGRGRSRERSRSRDGGRYAGPRPLSRAEALEVVDRMIKRFDLDDRAAQAMRSLHADDAMKIMEDIQRSTEVRNASAFAYTAAKKLLGSFNAEDAQRKFDLDETAVSCLNAILPSEAREILDSIDDGLRNPSAFVTAQVRRLHPELPALGAARGAPDAACAGAAAGPRGSSSLRTSFPPGMSAKEMEEEVEGIMRSMNLDERATGVLHEVPLEKAMDILGELRRNWTNVRNPSAYVFNACVKEINSHPGRGAPLGSLDAGVAGGAAFPPPPPGMPPGAPLGMPLPGMPGPLPGMPGGPPLGIPGPPPGLPLGMPGPPPGMPGPPPGLPPGAASAVPSAGPRADPAERKAEVQRAIEKWNLDETALGALLQIPADQALEILNSLDAGVRNPSAFVTTAARKRLDTGAGAPPQAGGSFGMASEDAVDFRRNLKEQVDNLIRKSDLDDKATNLLQELPLEGALEILGELQRKRDQVRNPSAYVFNAGVKFQEKLAHGRQPPPPGGGGGGSMLAQRVDQLAEHFRLDSYALSALRSVSLEAALGILDQMNDGLAGDPSDHVRRAVDRMHQSTRELPPLLDPFGNDQAIAHRAETMAREMGVDENSLAALQTVPLESAMHFLTRLADSRSSIRNPSAFIISAVKDYRAQNQSSSPVGPTAAPVAQGVSRETDPVVVGRQLDSTIQRLGLDRTAVEALRALPEEEALALVSSVDGSVRNPSAWVTNAARNALARLGEGRAGEGERPHGRAGEDERRYGAGDFPPPPDAGLPPLPPPPAASSPPSAGSPAADPRPASDGLPPAPPPPVAARDAPPQAASPAHGARVPPPPPPPPASSSASPPPPGSSGPGREKSPEDPRQWRKWDIHKWLDDVDGGTGSLVEYSTVLSRNLESPEQLVEIYCRKAEDGRHELEESFFRDVGVEDAGHQKLFHRWIDRHLND